MEIQGSDLTVEAVAREIYQQRSQSPREMTDERWEKIKRQFPQSVRICMADAEQMIKNGDLG